MEVYLFNLTYHVDLRRRFASGFTRIMSLALTLSFLTAAVPHAGFASEQSRTSGNASRDSVKIVGVGATSCAAYLQGAAENPATERDYVAWAQGFMSGVLMRAPEGRDVDLDLLPPTFPLVRQAEFLRQYCEANPTRGFTDGVLELYRLLRMPPS